MARHRSSQVSEGVSTSALDLFANAVGALAFLLLMFAASSLELIRPSALRILTTRVPVSRAGTDYLAVLSAVGGASPYRWALQEGLLPDGLTLDGARGEIAGTPQASSAGRDFVIGMLVTDQQNRRAESRFELRVLPSERETVQTVQPVVVLTRGVLPEAHQARAYALYLSARGGSGRYQWSAEGLPPGLSVASSSGLLSGTPAAGGSYELVLRVADERPGSGDAGESVASATLEIGAAAAVESPAAPAEATPEILTATLPPAVVLEPYEARLSGAGQDPLRWSARSLPPGLEIVERGVIRGRPTTAGQARVTVSMQDARQRQAADRVLVLSVQPPASRQASAERRRSWLPWWIGYVALALVQVAFLFLLDRRTSREIVAMLRRHGVDLIRRQDGTSALNGPPEHIEAFKAAHKQLADRNRRYKAISYATLGIVVLGYTIFLLR